MPTEQLRISDANQIQENDALTYHKQTKTIYYHWSIRPNNSSTTGVPNLNHLFMHIAFEMQSSSLVVQCQYQESGSVSKKNFHASVFL